MTGMEKVNALLSAWRAKGRSGLTLQFLAAAAKMDPEAILKEMQDPYRTSIYYYGSYCSTVYAPVFSKSIIPPEGHYMPFGNLYLYWNLAVKDLGSPNKILALANKAIADGKPSRRWSEEDNYDKRNMCDMPFSDSELKWVSEVLGT